MLPSYIVSVAFKQSRLESAEPNSIPRSITATVQNTALDINKNRQNVVVHDELVPDKFLTLARVRNAAALEGNAKEHSRSDSVEAKRNFMRRRKRRSNAHYEDYRIFDEEAFHAVDYRSVAVFDDDNMRRSGSL
jgi:hypothetical protein